MMKRFGTFSLALLTAALIAAQNWNAPVNYDESKVPAFELPDPLRCENGLQIETARQWESLRRPELLQMFGEQEYGMTPRRTGIKVKHEVIASTEGIISCQNLPRGMRQ